MQEDISKFWVGNNIVGSQFTIKQGDFVYNEAYNVTEGPKAGSIFNGTDFSIYMDADDTIKPFLPGFVAGNDKGYVEGKNSLYTPDKIAGVDSIGMLLGSLAMSSNSGNIVTALNKFVVTNIDNYYKMNDGAVAGLGDDKKPLYYVKDEDSILNQVYKFQRSDLERNTVLVPDLAEAQEGDLLVKYNEKGKMHIGIIVALGWKLNNTAPPPKGSDVRLYWDQVYVVSVRAGFQMVSVGKWGNSEMMMSGFSVTPEEYQIRRLLKKRRDFTKRPDNETDDWELVKDMVDSLSCRVHLPDNFDASNTINHWIPNTNDGLGPIYITFEGRNKGGQVMSLQDAYDVVLLPPADQYFNRTETDNRNIRTNKGTGIEIWARGIDINGNEVPDINGNGRKDFLLTSFHKREINEVIDIARQKGLSIENNDVLKNYCYRYSDDSTDYIDDEGKATNGGRLFIGRGSEHGDCLLFEVEYNGERRVLDKFYIKAINDNNIRPGDDFLLRFTLEDNTNVVATANDGDFIAVYDRILLDRANMYIDETIDPETGQLIDGAVDWNGENQIDIQYWTRFSDNHPVYGAVAYSWCCADWVTHFNDDLLDQLAAIHTFYNNTNQRWRNENNPHPNWANWSGPDGIPGNLDDTISPDSNWDEDILDNIEIGYLFSHFSIYENRIFNPLMINGVEYHPYKPGYTSYRGNLSGEAVVYSAGIDCSGFVERCCAYSGNNYELGNELESEERLTWVTSMNAWNLMAYHRYDGVQNDKVWEITSNNRSVIVPGDILRIPGDHVVIVLRIIYPNNNREVEDASVNILVIESTEGPNEDYRIMNIRTWNILGNRYRPERLRIKNNN